MSPEQLQGKDVDARSDLFSFGCVLYELLTSKRAFDGSNKASVIAAILEREPAPLEVARPLDRIVRRSLAKDPDQRFQTARDLKAALSWVLDQPPQVKAPSPSRLGRMARFGNAVSWLVVGVVTVVLVGVSFIHFREQPAAELTRFQIQAPEKVIFGAFLSLSPDGRRVAFSAASQGDGVFRVWVRPLDSLETRPLAGTDRQNNAMFWSPDSRSIAFGTGDGKLKRIEASGGPAQTLCDATGLAGGSGNRDGVIIFGGNGGLWRVSAAGGTASPLTAVNASRGEVANRFPFFLPDGQHFLYRRQARSADQSGIHIGSLDAKPDQQSSRRLLAADMAVYAPPAGSNSWGTRYGYVLFLREGTLMAQPFDIGRLALAGGALPVAEQVRTTGNGSGYRNGSGYFSASSNGVLAYGTGGSGTQLTWFDREGKILGTVGEAGSYSMPALSPDGKQAASQRTGADGSNPDLWTFEFARGVSTRFTFDPAEERSPVWSPDGSHIAFASNWGGQFNLYRKAVSSAINEETLLQSTDAKYPEDWSRDGSFLLYAVLDPKTKYDLWVLPLTSASSGERKPIKFLATEFNENQAQFSPDGHWIAYTSDESGDSEVYVRPFPEAGGKSMISKGRGSQPRWRRDGRELFYRSRAGQLMAVEVAVNTTFQPGTPQPLFTMDPGGASGIDNDVRSYDTAADGKRFLVNAPPGVNSQRSLTVVENWQSGLKK
jgi:eukaryotic-like serine/threonine-protein kinase